MNAIVQVNWGALGVSKEFVHTGNRFVGPFEAPYTILYNNQLVKPEESPKNWEDLLDPKWKGKIVTDTFKMDVTPGQPQNNVIGVDVNRPFGL